MRYVVNWPARMEEMVAFVGLTDDERQLIRASAPFIMDHARALTDAVYDHFMKFPQARKFFVTEDGQVDEVRLDRRKHTLARWLRDTAACALDESFAVHLLAMGISHRNLPTNRAHLGPVPSRYMIGTMSFAQTAIADLLRVQMPDTDLAFRTSTAWNKLLMIQLDLLLADYVTEDLR